MAVVRPARSAPPVALITFVFLFLVSTGVAIYLGLQWSASAEETKKLQDEMKVTMRPTDRPIRDQVISGNPNQSALAILAGQNVDLRALVGGEEAKKAPFDSLTRKAAEARGGNASLIAAIQSAQSSSSDLTAQIKADTDQITQLRKQVDTLKASYDADRATANASIETLTREKNGKVDEIAKTNASYKDQLDQQQKDSEAKLRQLDQSIRDMANARSVLEDRIETLKTDLAKAREVSAKTDNQPILWQADGKILRTSAGGDEIGRKVWINLGRKDRLHSNVTFSIYSPSLGVGSGPNARGKGAIEVQDVGETESMAVITHLEPGETFAEGDLIANLIFNKAGSAAQGAYSKDRTRVYRFCVYGDFDLDGDGIATPSERDHLIRMIQVWGGAVVDPEKFDSQTDFLVIGKDPVLTDDSSSATTQTSDLEARKAAQRDKLRALKKAAKENGIPILDANRFFAYIGYYNNTIVGQK